MESVAITGGRGGIGQAIANAVKYDYLTTVLDIDSTPSNYRCNHLVLANGVTERPWDETIYNNLTTSMRWAYASTPSKSLIFIGSLATILGFPGNPSYQASKSGLLGLMRALAVDLAPIRVNMISPGYIKTPMTLKSFTDKKRQRKIAKRSLLNRWGDPTEIASVVKFLISDGASFITGQNIIVDGGWSIKGL